MYAFKSELKQILCVEHQKDDHHKIYFNGDSIINMLIFFDACIKWHIQFKLFKQSITVVIPKPNKTDYTKL